MVKHHVYHPHHRSIVMQFYSLQTKETIEVPDAQVERTTMANGRPAARATITRDGKTLKLFKFLPASAASAASAPAAPAPAEAPAAKAKAKRSTKV